MRPASTITATALGRAPFRTPDTLLNDFMEGQRKVQLEIQNRLTVNPYVPDIGPIIPASNQTLLQIPV